MTGDPDGVPLEGASVYKSKILYTWRNVLRTALLELFKLHGATFIN